MSRVLSLLFCQLTISISLVAAAPIEPPNELVSQNQAFNQAFASGDYYGALDAALKSLRVTEANYPENHSYTAIAATNLAISYRALGRYDEAQPLYHRALRINRVLYGEKHKEKEEAREAKYEKHKEEGEHKYRPLPIESGVVLAAETPDMDGCRGDHGHGAPHPPRASSDKALLARPPSLD